VQLDADSPSKEADPEPTNHIGMPRYSGPLRFTLDDIQQCLQRLTWLKGQETFGN
jgi:hypothetical protein